MGIFFINVVLKYGELLVELIILYFWYILLKIRLEKGNWYDLLFVFEIMLKLGEFRFVYFV